MKKFTIQVQARFSEDTIKKMDELITNKKFDSRVSFIRLAVNDYLERYDKPILA